MTRRRQSDSRRAKSQQRFWLRRTLFKGARKYACECNADTCVIIRIREDGKTYFITDPVPKGLVSIRHWSLPWTKTAYKTRYNLSTSHKEDIQGPCYWDHKSCSRPCYGPRKILRLKIGRRTCFGFLSQLRRESVPNSTLVTVAGLFFVPVPISNNLCPNYDLLGRTPCHLSHYCQLHCAGQLVSVSHFSTTPKRCLDDHF
jgi:hypothetical protein